MLDQYFALYRHWSLLAFEAQTVVGLRMLRLAGGGVGAQQELHRMVAEKGDAAVMAGMDVALAFVAGRPAPEIARQAITGYRKRVRANRRRLSG